MTDTATILQKELSNLYALSKQINNYLDGSKIDFLIDRHQLNIGTYLKANCEFEITISEMLKVNSINPGNTIDSIIAEIVKNLEGIASNDMNSTAKQLGYLFSLNRLLSYQIANLENISFLKGHELGKILDGHINTLGDIKAKLLIA